MGLIVEVAQRHSERTEKTVNMGHGLLSITALILHFSVRLPSYSDWFHGFPYHCVLTTRWGQEMGAPQTAVSSSNRRPNCFWKIFLQNLWGTTALDKYCDFNTVSTTRMDFWRGLAMMEVFSCLPQVWDDRRGEKWEEESLNTRQWQQKGESGGGGRGK